MVDLWREVETEWHGGHTFFGKNHKGGTVQMNEFEGKPGVSPMELLLVGLAGCTGIDVVDILEKKRERLKALKVKVRGRRAEDFPKVYKEIEITYYIWGDGINPKSVERAIQLSEEKYCSVSAMFHSVAEIRSTYQLFNTEEQP